MIKLILRFLKLHHEEFVQIGLQQMGVSSRNCFNTLQND